MQGKNHFFAFLHMLKQPQESLLKTTQHRHGRNVREMANFLGAQGLICLGFPTWCLRSLLLDTCNLTFLHLIKQNFHVAFHFVYLTAFSPLMYCRNLFCAYKEQSTMEIRSNFWRRGKIKLLRSKIFFGSKWLVLGVSQQAHSGSYTDRKILCVSQIGQTGSSANSEALLTKEPTKK